MPSTPPAGGHFASASDRLLNHFATALHGDVENNSLSIDPKEGNGTVSAIPIIDGLDIIVFDVLLNYPHTIRKVSLNPGPARSFYILCSLTPEHFAIRKKNQSDDLSQIIFSATDEDVDIIIKPNSRAKAVFIFFTSEWLKKETQEANPDILFLAHDLISRKKPLFFTKHDSFSLSQMAADIHNSAIKTPPDTFRIKAKVISVVHDLLTHLLSFSDTEKKEHDAHLHEKVSAIEQILLNHLHDNLPPLRTIAKQLALSESTLKRNFKMIHDSGIYEFYLKNKMQWGRQLLEEKGITVKEVAHRLGYEKTSNFIKIFRKFYDCSPGTLKKKAS